eukprot:11310061-Alexandrium_andersonii.AAC.1
MKVPFRLPHEIFHEDLTKDPDAWFEAASSMSTENWRSNEFVRSFPDQRVPGGLFVDGAPFSKTDAVTVWFMNNPARRHRFAI